VLTTDNWVVVQFGLYTTLSSWASVLCAAKDPGEPRDASLPALRERMRPKGPLRRNNRALGSLPYQTEPHNWVTLIV